ncbi:MAG: hypothetical protein M1268_00110 [Patescibacteria group bacterium]|nr:hypothetical protein [Patescibacteria group bacterium]
MSPEYIPPEDDVRIKFVRIGENVIVTDIGSPHEGLVIKDGLWETLIELRKKGDFEQLDAGFLASFGRRILIGGGSQSLGLPVAEEARKISVEVIKAKSPDHEVIGRY